MARNCEHCILNETEACPRRGDKMPSPRKCMRAINSVIEPPITLAEYYFRVNRNDPAIDRSDIFKLEYSDELITAARKTVLGNGSIHPLIRDVEPIYESGRVVGNLIFPRDEKFAIYSDSNNDITIVPYSELLNF
jgi:hypothetical protein